MPLLEPWPVVLERVAAAAHDVVRRDAAHHEVHAREVVGVLFELLGVVLDGSAVALLPGDRLADGDEKRARAGGRVVYGDLAASRQVLRHDPRDEGGNLMRSVELAGLLAGVGGEVAYQVLVDVAEHVIALLAVHGYVADEL